MSDTLFLAPEALFPVVYDPKGDKIQAAPATGFAVAGTIQGEGKMAGVTTLFLRTSGCNLRCMWRLPNGQISICDTPHASFDTRIERRFSVEEIANQVLLNAGNINHLVISGGEPLIQADALVKLITLIRNRRPNFKVAIETNGTLFHEGLFDAVNFFSISPKLTNSLPTVQKLAETDVVIPAEIEKYRDTHINVKVLQQYITGVRQSGNKDFQLKFVVAHQDECNEIENTVLRHLSGFEPEDIVLMPLGSTPEELAQTRMIALEAAIGRGWRFSPRLQVTYFNGRAGV
jgi:7-carboxy-7-deazaguanine synthase